MKTLLWDEAEGGVQRNRRGIVKLGLESDLFKRPEKSSDSLASDSVLGIKITAERWNGSAGSERYRRVGRWWENGKKKKDLE